MADPRMSRNHAVLSRGVGGLSIRDAGSRNGIFVDTRRTSKSPLQTDSVVRMGDTVFLVERDDLPLVDDALGIVGRSESTVQLKDAIRRAAPSGLAILITGPTGTGKELVAAAIHRLSRRTGKLVPVNCAALPETLVEKTLFGHLRGAFTDAGPGAKGVFQQADGGTVFLDEIGEMALPAQAKLLRTLESGEVTPLGAAMPVVVDARVVTATNAILGQAVEDFRADLLARICGIPIETSALAERKCDVLPLFEYLLPPADRPRPRSADFTEAMLAWGWPLNVRELKQLAARLAVMHPEAPRWVLSHLPDAMSDAIRNRRDEAKPPWRPRRSSTPARAPGLSW